MIERLINLLPIVSCQEATRLMSLSMERKLSFKESFNLKLHWMVCSLCGQFHKQIEGLRALLRSYSPCAEHPLSSQAKDQIKQRLKTK
jgi:hypothetical protein